MEYQEFPEKFLLTPIDGLFEQDPLTEHPRYLAEGLFYYPLPEDVEPDDEFELSIYNIIRNIPSMKGIPYINAITGKNDILFPEAYIIQTPAKPKIPQNLEPLTYVPQQERLYAYITESQFGSSRYEITLNSQEIGTDKFHPQLFQVDLTNLNLLTFLKLPAVTARHMQVRLSVFPVQTNKNSTPAQTGYILYGIWLVQIPKNLPILFIDTEAMFINRMRAMDTWFDNALQELLIEKSAPQN